MSSIRLAKIPAWYAKSMMANKTEPEDWVLWCEVKDGNVWRRFEDFDDIDNHVSDWIELADLSERMVNYNIGFMNNFRFNKVSSNIAAVLPCQLDPMFHSVMANGYATLNELRTIYSLEDVFLMLDSITTTRKNEKIAMDVAKQEAANGR